MYALLRGTRGLPKAESLHNNVALLRLIRRSVAIGESERIVRWNGITLTEQFMSESRNALENLQVGDGYFASSCDPLLVSFAATFKVDVHHEFCGHVFRYQVDDPLRTVFLSSSSSHMEFAGIETAHQLAHGRPRRAARRSLRAAEADAPTIGVEPSI